MASTNSCRFRRVFAATLVVVGLCCSIVAQSQPPRGNSSPWSDSRIIKWAALERAGALGELITAVDTDLRSDNPHPFASYSWTVAQPRSAAEPRSTSQLTAKLGEVPEIVNLSSSAQFDAMLKKYPANMAA